MNLSKARSIWPWLKPPPSPCSEKNDWVEAASLTCLYWFTNPCAEMHKPNTERLSAGPFLDVPAASLCLSFGICSAAQCKPIFDLSVAGIDPFLRWHCTPFWGRWMLSKLLPTATGCHIGLPPSLDSRAGSKLFSVNSTGSWVFDVDPREELLLTLQ